MTLAFSCIVAVALGTLSVRWGLLELLPIVVVAVVVASFVWAGRARGQVELGSVLCAGLIVCTGLVRGASAFDAPARVGERGFQTTGLRDFEVVHASRPGPRCELELRDPGAEPWAPTIRVSAPDHACPRAHGDRVAVSAQALRSTWSSPREDGRFDLGRGHVVWSRPRGSASAKPLETLQEVYWRRIAQLRQRAWLSTRGDRSASLIIAAGLGLRSAIEPRLRAQLRAAGLGHLIAVSGLHVAIAALWLLALTRRIATLIGLDPRQACVVAWLPLWAYVGLTGGAASAVRAAAMLTAVDLGVVVGRPSHGPTTLVTVAAGMLLWRPHWLVDPGFALSLAAMMAIVTAPRADGSADAGADRSPGRRSKLGILAMSWRITWATAPLSVLFFDAAPLHGLIGNAVALPLFSLMMPAAIVASVATGPLGAAALGLARLPAAPILDLAELLARVPPVGAAGLLAAALVALLVGRLVAGQRAWLPPRVACVLAAAIAVAVLIGDARRARTLHVRTYDWIAIGTPRSRSLLVADRSRVDAACLYRPRGSARSWERVLREQGVSRLSLVDAKLPSAGHDRPRREDPGVRALAVELADLGIELASASTGGQGCSAPEPERVRAALRACVARQGGRGRALARSFAGAIDCDLGDRWVRATELRPQG